MAASPPRWEIGLYAAGALALLGIAAVNLWKLWRSGSYPAPSPFPNYDYRYLEQKYGAACPDVRNKVRGWQAGLPPLPLPRASCRRGRNSPVSSGRVGEKPRAGAAESLRGQHGAGELPELRELQDSLPWQLEAKRGPRGVQKGGSESQLSPAPSEGTGWQRLVFLPLSAARDGTGLAEGAG